MKPSSRLPSPMSREGALLRYIVACAPVAAAPAAACARLSTCRTRLAKQSPKMLLNAGSEALEGKFGIDIKHGANW
jgi:hypothetical protein